jgi:ankyrin repeat protein
MNTDWLYTIDAHGETPLTRVSKSGRIEIARLMLMQEIEDTLREISHLSPLHRAAYWGYEDAIVELIEEGEDVNGTDSQGETPLHKAVRLGNLGAVEVLLDHGAHINASSAMGLTPLHWAALTGQVELTEYLLENGANAHDRDCVLGGMTALDFARIMKYEDVVEVLRRHMSIF